MKLQELQRHLKEKGIKRAVFYGTDSNLRYLTGIDIPYSVLEVMPDNAVLHVAGFEAERAREETGIAVKEVKTLRLEREGKTGIVPSQITHKYSQHYETEDIEEFMAGLREQKTEEEIQMIKEACKITDEIFETVMEKEHATEEDIYRSIMVEIHKRGLEASFTPIVATGKNAGKPHHKASRERLKGFTIIDLGVKHKGYCSDMTRTAYYGEPTQEEKEEYEKVLRIQEQAIKKKGTLEEIDAWAKAQLPNMIHKIGHSIGTEVHDPEKNH